MSFFKQRKPKTFEHQPIYYDARKEAREERIQKIKADMGVIDEKGPKKDFEKNIRGSFREAVPGGSRTNRQQNSNKILRILVVLCVVIIIVYFLVSRYAQ